MSCCWWGMRPLVVGKEKQGTTHPRSECLCSRSWLLACAVMQHVDMLLLAWLWELLLGSKHQGHACGAACGRLRYPGFVRPASKQLVQSTLGSNPALGAARHAF